MSVEEIFGRGKVEKGYIQEWKEFKESGRRNILIEIWQKQIEEIEAKT